MLSALVCEPIMFSEYQEPFLLPKPWIDVLQKQKSSTWFRDGFKLSSAHRLLLESRYQAAVAAQAIASLENPENIAINWRENWPGHIWVVELRQLSQQADYLKQTLLQYSDARVATKNKEADLFYEVAHEHFNFLEQKVCHHSLKLLDSLVVSLREKTAEENTPAFFVRLWLKMQSANVTLEQRNELNRLWLMYHQFIRQMIFEKEQINDDMTRELTLVKNQIVLLTQEIHQLKENLSSLTKTAEYSKSTNQQLLLENQTLQDRIEELSIPVEEIEERYQNTLRKNTCLEAQMKVLHLENDIAKARVAALTTDNLRLQEEYDAINTWRAKLKAQELVSDNAHSFFAAGATSPGDSPSKRTLRENAYLRLRIAHLQEKFETQMRAAAIDTQSSVSQVSSITQTSRL